MITVTNKLLLIDIAKIIGVAYLDIYYSTKIKGTTYEKYFAKVPEPTFIEGKIKYYNGEAIEKFKIFFDMDKMQKTIFKNFKKQDKNDIRYV